MIAAFRAGHWKDAVPASMLFIELDVNPKHPLVRILDPVYQVSGPGEEDVLRDLTVVLSTMLGIVADEPTCPLELGRFPHCPGAQVCDHMIGGTERPAAILPVHAILGRGDTKPFTGAVLSNEIVEIVGPTVVVGPSVPLRLDQLRPKDHRSTLQ